MLAGSGCHGAPWEPLAPSPSPHCSRGWCRTRALSETGPPSLSPFHVMKSWQVIAMILNHRQYLDILFFTTIITTTATILIIRSTFDELKMQSGSRVSGSRPSTSCSPQGPLNIMLEIVIIIVIRTGATSKRCQKEMIGVECRYWSSDHQCKLFFRDWRWVSPRWR